MNPVFEDAFFVRDVKAPYTERHCAYAVICNDEGKFAFVDVGGKLFLVGGGIDAGETAEQTVVREAAEEIGASVKIVRKIGDAEDYIFGSREQAWVHKFCSFYEARIDAMDRLPKEADHLLVWCTPEEAAPIARQRSHIWAARQVLEGA